jgi:hypothetical protein
MRYIVSFILLSLTYASFSQSAISHNGKNEVYSEYKDGRYFHTHCVYLVNAPFNYAAEILDEVFEGMKTAPTANLNWAFSGLGDVGAKEDMLLSEKGVSYNPTNAEYLLNLQIIVKDGQNMEVEVAGNLKKRSLQTGEKTLTLEVTKKIKVLQDGMISIAVVPYTNNSSIVILHSKLKFGWFFNLFFSQKRYRDIMEWRFAGFLKNIKEKIELTAKENEQQSKSESNS